MTAMGNCELCGKPLLRKQDLDSHAKCLNKKREREILAYLCGETPPTPPSQRRGAKTKTRWVHSVDFRFAQPLARSAVALPGKATPNRRTTDRSPGPQPVPQGNRVFFRRRADDEILLTTFNHWWDGLCNKHGLNPRHPILESLAYHVIGVVKNAIGRADKVGAAAYFTSSEAVVIVADDGAGLDDLSPGADATSLIEGLLFADSFIVRSNGGTLIWDGAAISLSRAKTLARGTRIEITKTIVDGSSAADRISRRNRRRR